MLYIARCQKNVDKNCCSIEDYKALHPIGSLTELYKTVDNQGVLKNDLLFIDKERKLLIPSGSRLTTIEVMGKEVSLIKNEGERLRKNEKIAYIITGKREVRVVRAPEEGVIIAIFTKSYSHPQCYSIVIAGVSHDRKLHREQDWCG